MVKAVTEIVLPEACLKLVFYSEFKFYANILVCICSFENFQHIATEIISIFFFFSLLAHQPLPPTVNRNWLAINSITVNPIVWLNGYRTINTFTMHYNSVTVLDNGSEGSYVSTTDILLETFPTTCSVFLKWQTFNLLARKKCWPFTFLETRKM